MRKVILYIAVSLDGYIADGKGAVDWIGGHDENVEMEDTFTPFFSGVDMVIMGRKTYNQIVTELSPDRWPYEGATTYVLTHHKETDNTKNICFKNIDVCRFVEEVAQQLISNNLIDTYHLVVIPVILGGGISLFGGFTRKIDLTLVETKKYNGIVEVIYNQKQI